LISVYIVVALRNGSCYSLCASPGLHPHLSHSCPAHRGEGMTDGGGFVLPIPPAVVLWTKGEISMLATEKHPTARFFRTSKALHPVIAARDSFSAIPHDPPRRRNDGWGRLCTPHPHPVHCGEGMTDGGALSSRSHLGLTALCPLDERRDIAACYRKAPDCQVFFEHQRWFIRSSLTEIPSRPFRTIHCGEGMTDGGLCPPDSAPLCHLDVKRDIAACYGKAPDCQVFFELQRHFIRSSLTEIPSWPFRTIHCGEGMTDRGLCPPHPHLVHCGEGMTDGGGFVLPIPPAVVLWTKGEISLLATEKHPTARFFRTSKALHPVIAARDSFSAIPHDPPRRRNDGWGALLPGSHRPLSSGRKERLSLLATEKHPTARFFRTSKALHPVIAARDSFSAIPHDPPRRRNDGWGALSSRSHLPLSSGRKERYRCLLQKSARLPGFFELQRRFIRSSLAEIPSRPFRTIHRGEGMTEGGLYPPHPHPVHRGEGMMDVAWVSPALCLLRKSTPARFFSNIGSPSLALCPLAWVSPPFVLWTKGEIIAACYRKAPDCQVFSNFKGTSSGHRCQRFLLGHSARSTAAKE
jgi:hypothetical protein